MKKKMTKTTETVKETPNTTKTEQTLNKDAVNVVDLKKRGRRPKGGKIIKETSSTNADTIAKPNIILHLRCFLKDISTIYEQTDIKSFNFDTNALSYETIEQPETNNKYLTTTVNNVEDTGAKQQKDIIYKKLKTLEHNLYLNNIPEKSSACFWCSYDFDTPTIYIPKFYLKDTYHVYGCFCSPECAVAHLMEENIDNSTKFERYYLLNHIYSNIYEYKKNIKPAPNPHYILEKFYGNLTINEYRELLHSGKLFLMVDKPLTRIMPEFHEDNDDYIINNKIIPSSSNYQIKKSFDNCGITPKTPIKNIFNLMNSSNIDNLA